MTGSSDGSKTEFLLTRPLRDVTLNINPMDFVDKISTHTPLAGRDDRRGYSLDDGS